MSDHEQLIPSNLRRALPGLYSTEHDDDPMVRTKLFTPWSNWTWYVTEFDGDDVLFGLVDGHEVELGYFAVSDLEALEGPGGVRVECDQHFTPRPLSQVRKEIAKLRGESGAKETQEERPSYAGTPIPRLFMAAADPLMQPAIAMVETQLSSAWSTAVSETIATPSQAAAILHHLIGDADREHFVALYLNARHQVTHAHIVSRGAVQTAPVHPREVFKGAVLANAVAVVVGHNHPSGDVQPSPDDKMLVDRLKTAGEVLGIEVIDALIVGPTRRYYATSNDGCAFLEPVAGSVDDSPNASAEAIARLAETARFILGGSAGDMLEESADELAQQVLAFTGALRNSPAWITNREAMPELERACRGLLQDIEEVLERQGESWWDETVTSGLHHRMRAEWSLGRTPYGPRSHEPGGPEVL